ncbi:D-alanyl-D-alanine carboxypeptidase [Methylobacterium sp. C25]|uniref:D-alanyl-D-alanine carboxypeptidase family protein n=1 Tax=Methylobacterium sp. C25 TaxID=2721622 RepID=UPI001F2AD476|nr:D-alanyl-D-alanine carboxypeptidase family protein [Methylobacterium sp. C25]MCE4224781.1 D-alanyl-D-alanine carboxypeptidase [Methylobacterium sp. C25]
MRASRAILRAATVLAAVFSLATGTAIAQTFQTSAPHAILVDAESGAVLFEKAADEPFSPASMAKLMTTEIVFSALKEGRLTMDTEFTVTEDAWKRGGAGGGGSSMFAQVNSRIKMSDLLRGLIVQSGNDAAITIAENMAGTEEAFAGLMNQRAKEIGLTHSTFRNATGYSAPDQKVTARDMAKIAQHIIETYPDLYKIFAEREFTWNKIKQQNRNPLLTLDIGADGLKTGYLEESGYALTGSAVQNGQRLIMVLSGLKTARDRASESRKLMEWGLRAFDNRQIFQANETVAEVPVYGGDKGSVAVVAKKTVRLLQPRGSSERMSARVVYKGPLVAPIEQGQQVGTLRVMRGDTIALDQPLYAADPVATGTLTQRAFDAALEVGGDLVRKAFDKARGGGKEAGSAS